MERLKVLFVTIWYPSREQPLAGLFVREHARAAQLYDDVVVLHCAGLDPSPRGIWRVEREHDQAIAGGIPTFRVLYRRSPVPKTSYLLNLWSALRATRLILGRSFRPDIVHGHVYTAAVTAVLIGRIHRLPVVLTEHCTDFPRRVLHGATLWKARLAFRAADIVLPVSRSLQRAIEGYGISGRFRVVPNVVDTRLFRPGASARLPNGLKRLLTVCMLGPSPNKGIPYLLRALAQGRNQRDDWHLDLVGDGPARAQYECMAEELGLTEKVTFRGFQPHEAVAELMRRADLFVLPSLTETFSVVVAEALASGLPVLATRCGGPEEYITEEVGLLVPPGDAEALWRGLDTMLDRLPGYSGQRISDYARERFSRESVGAQLDTVYRSLARPRGARMQQLQ